MLNEYEPTIPKEYFLSSTTLEPAFNYKRRRRSAALSPEILLIKRHTKESIEDLIAWLEEIGLKSRS